MPKTSIFMPKTSISLDFVGFLSEPRTDRKGF